MGGGKGIHNQVNSNLQVAVADFPPAEYPSFRIIQWSGEYYAGGAIMYYTREGETEELFMPGPLTRPLTLLVGQGLKD